MPDFFCVALLSLTCIAPARDFTRLLSSSKSSVPSPFLSIIPKTACPSSKQVIFFITVFVDKFPYLVYDFHEFFFWNIHFVVFKILLSSSDELFFVQFMKTFRFHSFKDCEGNLDFFTSFTVVMVMVFVMVIITITITITVVMVTITVVMVFISKRSTKHKIGGVVMVTIVMVTVVMVTITISV